jgi:YidC/Oxa1 family membrane protein insertase
MNPAGCLLPMLIQMPIWIALYQSIVRVLAVAPVDFLNLSKHLYASWPLVFTQVPLQSRFLWLDLAYPDSFLILPILVGGTMWVQQKMTTLPSTDPKQQSQAQMMLWMMPLMFAFLTLSFPSGLALYWVVSNVISIVLQYFVTGWGGLIPAPSGKKSSSDKKTKEQATQQKMSLKEGSSETTAETGSAQGGELDHGKSGDKRQDRGRGDSARPGTTRRKTGGG